VTLGHYGIVVATKAIAEQNRDAIIMWRSVIAAAVVYAYGHPGFDGYRPGVFDRPLHAFYTEVNQAARDGKRALSLLDDARAMRYLKGYIDNMDALLKSNS
jgi:hypothetical protein